MAIAREGMLEGFKLLEKLGVDSERLIRWLDHLGSGLGGVVRFGIYIAVGLIVGAIFAGLLFVAVSKFGAALPGAFARRDMFPGVMSAAMVVIPAIGAFAAQGWKGSLGGLISGISGAIGIHPRLLEIQQNARKEKSSAKSTPEPPVAQHD